MIKKLLSLLALTGVCYVLNAQQPSQSWVKTINSAGRETINNMMLDASGNIYTLGTFSGTVDFDPSAAAFNATSTGTNDIFVQKLDANGNFLWVSAFQCSLANRSNPLFVDASGVYLTATFTGIVDFDPGPGTNTIVSLPNANNANACILKLTAAGALDWVKVLKGNNFTVLHPTAITVDNLGNVYAGGAFVNMVDFNTDPAPAATFTVISAGGFGADAYLLKLDNNGDFISVKVFGGQSYCDVKPSCLRADQSNNIVMSGNMNTVTNVGTSAWNVDFDPSAAVYTLAVSDVNSDAFVSKFDATGAYLWTKAILAGASDDTYNSFQIDATGNIYLTGRVSEENIDMDPGPANYTVPVTPGMVYGNNFIQKLDAAGNFMWVKMIKDAGYYGQGISLALDNAGNVYATGKSVGNVDFNPGMDSFVETGTNNAFSSNTSFDMYVSKLSQNGDFVWGRLITGAGNNAATGIGVDAQSNVYVAGYFTDTVNFSSSPVGNNTITSAGVSDGFILKWSQCGTSQTVTASAVCKYTYQANSYTASGNYHSYGTGIGGCDSLTIMKVTIHEFTTSVSNAGNVLTCNTPNASSYQWYLCSIGYSILTGETAHSYAPVGYDFRSFAVIVVSADGCTDTTECMAALIMGLHESNGSLSLRTYPNPVKNKLTIDLAQQSDFISVEVVDAIGKPVKKATLTNTATIDLDLDCAPGIYFGTVKTPTGQKSIKIIKD